MKISIAIMAHPNRRKAAESLFVKIAGYPFSKKYIAWDSEGDIWDTTIKAVLAHGDSDWHVVLQDDAIIGNHFYDNIVNALSMVPEQSLVSLYTGTVRPYAKAVDASVERAEESRVSWLSAKTLLWGVGIAIPTNTIDALLMSTKHSRNLVQDARIGSYFKKRGQLVYYTNPSLVDHDYTLGSLIGNDYASEPRVARKFVGDEVVAFNNKVEQITTVTRN